MTTALILAVVALLIATAGLCLVVLAQAEALKSQRPTEKPHSDGRMNLARALLAPDVDVPLDRTHHDDIDLTDAELDAWDQIRDRHWKP